MYQPLAEADPEVQNIIDKETWRQFTGLELIASEVTDMTAFVPIILLIALFAEPYQPCHYASQRFNPDEQVLRRSPKCPLLRRKRMD